MPSIKASENLKLLFSKDYTKIYLWCFVVVAFWRFLLEIVNHTFIKLIPTANVAMSGMFFGLDRWLAWDGKWYYSIFERGYSYSPAVEAQSNVAFFPGFPVATYIFSWITHLNVVYAGLLLNFILTTFSAYFVYRITQLLIPRLHKTDAGVIIYAPKLAVVFFLVMPTSLFLAAYYAEALLIFGISGAIYFALKNKLIVASLFAAIASSSKSLGVAIAPTILLIYFLQNNPSQRDKRAILRQLPLYLIVTLISLSGLFAYMFFLRNRFDDPLLFAHIQSHWQREISGNFMVTIWNDNYRYLFLPSHFGGAFNYLIKLHAMLMPIGALFVALWATVKYRLLWVLCLTGIIILLPISTSSLTSMNRYAYAAVPLYCLLAVIIMQSKYRLLIVPVCVVMYTFLLYFTMGFLTTRYFAG